MGWFSGLFRPNPEKVIARADKAYDAGGWADALELYEQVDASAPDADRIAERALTCRRKLHRINMDEAERYAAAGQRERAAEHYELAARFAPSDEAATSCEDALTTLARDAAREDADASSTVDVPEGALIDDVQTLDLLLARFPEEVVDRYHDEPQALRDAVLALHDGRPGDAWDRLEPLVTDGASTIVRFEAARTLRALGRIEDALDATEGIDDASDAWSDAWLLRARLAWMLRRWDVAEGALQAAVDDDAENVSVLAAIASDAIFRRAPHDGLEAIGMALELAPRDRSLKLLQARLLELLGRDAPAIEIYESIVRATWSWDPDTSELRFDPDSAQLAALHYLRTGQQLERAAELMRALVAASPPSNRWRPQLDLAAILQALGDDEAATTALKGLRRTLPADQTVGHARVAQLLGDETRLAELIVGFDEADRGRWLDLLADRGVDPPTPS